MNRSEKKRILVMLTLGALLAVAVAVILPVKRKWDFYNKTINERQSAVKLYQQQIVNKDPLAREVERLNDIYDKTGFFMRAENGTNAGANLQKIVRGILDKNQVAIRSTQVTPASLVPANRAEIKANTVFSSINSFMTVLEAFNSNQPTLRVTTAIIRPQSSPQMVKQGKAYVRKNLENGQLHINMTIQTFYEGAE